MGTFLLDHARTGEFLRPKCVRLWVLSLWITHVQPRAQDISVWDYGHVPMGTITHIQASSQDLMVSEIVGNFLLETPPSGEFPRLKPVGETIDTFWGGSPRFPSESWEWHLEFGSPGCDLKKFKTPAYIFGCADFCYLVTFIRPHGTRESFIEKGNVLFLFSLTPYLTVM